MNSTLTIPDKLVEKAATFGEYSYGATRVILILADGRRIHDVFLAWGAEITKIGSRLINKPDELDFQIQDIADIQSQ